VAVTFNVAVVNIAIIAVMITVPRSNPKVEERDAGGKPSAGGHDA
jgi:hypothetical protein